MSDQAAALRERRAERAAPHSARVTGPPVIVLGSGKGGVGKSVLAAALAVEIARSGKRVLLFDAAQNQGSQHILLGVRPRRPLADVMNGDAPPEDLLVEVESAPGVMLLPADSGDAASHARTPTDRARLHLRLTALFERFEAVIVDAGPDHSTVVRAAATRASALAVVAVPEPASLAEAYAAIKLVHQHVPELPLHVLVNRVEDDHEGPAVHERLDLAARRFLQRGLGYLGAVPEQAALRRAAREPGSLAGAAPEGIAAIAARLMEQP